MNTTDRLITMPDSQCNVANYFAQWFDISQKNYTDPYYLLVMDWRIDKLSPHHLPKVMVPPQSKKLALFIIFFFYAFLRVVGGLMSIYLVESKMKERQRQMKRMRRQIIPEMSFEIKFYQRFVRIFLLQDLVQAVFLFVFFGSFQYQSHYQIDVIRKNTTKFQFDNCLFVKRDLSNFQGKWKEHDHNVNMYFLFLSVSWMLFTSANFFSTAFAGITLSRVNQHNLRGWPFIKQNLKKSLAAAIILLLVLFIVLFLMQYQIYIFMLNIETMGFWLSVRTLFCWVIYDKLLHKKWILGILKLPSLERTNTNWQADQQQSRSSVDNHTFDLSHQNPAVQSFIERNREALENMFRRKLADFYYQNIDGHYEQYQTELRQKTVMQWANYVNFILIVNMASVMGFLLLSADYMHLSRTVSHTNPLDLEDPSDLFGALFYCGVTLVLVSQFIYELCHGFALYEYFCEKISEQLLRPFQESQVSVESREESILTTRHELEPVPE